LGVGLFPVFRAAGAAESLKKDVMGSVKFVMLILRFVQLFVADLPVSAFDKVRLIDPETGAPKKKN
ncbi:MAG TPA: hypothetical protein PKE53_06710, partial [Flavobacteriales bacterium]|nr:hypothetical protein [Flavobacteriales bacterium]